MKSIYPVISVVIVKHWRRVVLITVVLAICYVTMLPLFFHSRVAGQTPWAQVMSWPKDDTPYFRKLVPEDLAPNGAFAMTSAIFIRDLVVSNTDPSLNADDREGDSEPSIAINPANPNEIAITAFSGGWGANAVLWHSTDGGNIWTREASILAPPGRGAGGPNDQTIDYGRGGRLSGTFLKSGRRASDDKRFSNVLSGTTTNPALSASWNWLLDAMGVTTVTNINSVISDGLPRTDQPWLLVNRDPVTATQDNVYVAYDDFNASPVRMRVAAAYGTNPPNFTTDNPSGVSGGDINPGHRLAVDPRTGFIYSVYQRSPGDGAGGSKSIQYKLNRSRDGGATWSLNGDTNGIVVVTADSTQPDKFGTVNALLGGVEHASVDPTTGDVYYVYGTRNGAGNNRLAIRRIQNDGAMNVTVGAEFFVTGEIQAALPSVAITNNGTVGVLYTQFEGFSSDDFPIFSAHFAISEDHGQTFNDNLLLRFLSSAKNECPGEDCERQRVLGDYQQVKAVGNTFYGVFTGNGAPLGRPLANHDPIFFKVPVGGATIKVNAPTAFGDVCVGSFRTNELEVFNTGNGDLVVNSVTRISGSSDITIDTNPVTPLVIAAGSHVDFTVRCAPGSSGSKTATIRIESNDADKPQTDLIYTCNATTKGISTFIADSGNFGNVCLDSFKDLDLTISNSGSCDLTISSMTITPSTDFLLPNPPATPLVIHGGNSIQIPLRYMPTAVGPTSATLKIISDDPTNGFMHLVSVKGIGQAPKIVVPAMIDFGKVCPGETGNATLKISNTGFCDLIVKSITSSNPLEFKVAPSVAFPLIVPPGSTRDVAIQFMPVGFTVNPMRMATLTIMSNDPDAPMKDVKVIGTVPPPVIQAMPDPLDFGKVCLGKSKELPLAIRNTGECNLAVSGITFSSPEFKLVSPPPFPFVVPPGGSRIVTVSFMPVGATGPRMETMSINSDDPATPIKVVTLKGEAPVSDIAISGPTDWGDVAVGRFKDQVINITNTEACDIAITLVCEVRNSMPQQASVEFNLVSPLNYPVIIPGGATLAVRIRFKPERTGPRSAMLFVCGFDPQVAGGTAEKCPASSYLKRTVVLTGKGK